MNINESSFRPYGLASALIVISVSAWYPDNDSATLLLVQLDWDSWLFPDVYFDRYHHHFTIRHDSGRPSNVGHPQNFVGTLLHNTFQARDKPSPKAKLPPAFLDHLTKFPIDSHVQEYRDWTTNCNDRTPQMNILCGCPMSSCPTKLIWGLRSATGLYPRVACCWRLTTMDQRCSLDPAEHPRPATQSHHESAGPSSEDERRRRRKKKHHRPKKPELKVTPWGQGDDVPVWSHAGSNLSLSSESQTEGDSGIRFLLEAMERCWVHCLTWPHSLIQSRHCQETRRGWPRGCSTQWPWWEQWRGARDGEQRWRG